MKILVTGASGFVGSHLIPLLQKSGHHLTALYHRNLPKERHGLRWVFCDLENPSGVLRRLKEIRPEAVLHLAAKSSVAFSWKNPSESLSTNIFVAFNLLEAIRRSGLSLKLIFTSSFQVYGRSFLFKGRVSEKEGLLPFEPYSVGKACGDLVTQAYLHHLGLQAVILRPCNIIGPGQSPEFAVSNFCRQVALMERGKKRPLLETGNLESMRIFVDVRDVVRAYDLVLRRFIPGEIYNLGAGNPVGLKEIVALIRRRSSIRFKVVRTQGRLRIGELVRLRGDFSKIKRELGWAPRIPLEQSVTDCLQWWRERI